MSKQARFKAIDRAAEWFPTVKLIIDGKAWDIVHESAMVIYAGDNNYDPLESVVMLDAAHSRIVVCGTFDFVQFGNVIGELMRGEIGT